MIKSPFKFLDSYTREDRGIFFGRDQEITDLYRRVFDSKILLVYGISGTGKSSLINCGLASRFDDSDWLPVNVRRGSNIIVSLNEAFKKQALTPLNKTQSVSEKLQSIYLDHFKPVYLIFDQFEELFIFGSADEKTDFIKLIKEVVDSATQCRVMFIIREEFLAGITEFEYDLPEIFSNRYRVEKMKRAHAISTIEGPCKVNSIETAEGFSDELVDKLCPVGNEIELTFLQIYLDRIFRIAGTEKQEKNELKFSKELLDKAGSVSDLLGQFLEEQIRELDNPDTGMSILKSFVSVQGTKRQMNESEILESVNLFGTVITEADLLNYLTKFVDLRILRERDEAGHFELRHDSLASKIYEKFTVIEKDIIEVRQFIENAYSTYEKREKLLTSDDLKYIAPYEDKLYLSKPLKSFITTSWNEITRIKRRRRTFVGSAALALIIVLSGLTIWALNEREIAYKEREIAKLNYLNARAASYNYLSQKVVETDPTIALRLAEYALTLDSVNPDIIENPNRIYFDNNFYTIIVKHEDIQILSIAFSPDGNSFLAGADDNAARLFDLNGNLLQLFKGHEHNIWSVAFSPDGKGILTGSWDRTAILWDLQGNVLQIFKGHEGEIYSVAFSPDGKYILTGSTDKTARLWDLNGNLLHAFKGHEGEILSVAFSPTGKSILTTSLDGTARLWELNGGLLQIFKRGESIPLSVSFSPDGKSILSGSSDNIAQLWDLKGNVQQLLTGHGNMIFSVTFSKDGRTFLTGSYDKTARLWDLKGNMLQIFKGHEGLITSVSISPDGKSILTCSMDKTVRLWKLQGNMPQIFVGHDKSVSSVAYLPDGERILTGSDDKTARLWDNQGNVIQVFKGHKNAIYSVAASPDGKYILTGSGDSTARLWDLHGNVLQVFSGHENLITSVAFSPDGRSILTGSWDKTARLWNLDGNVLQVFKGHEGEIFTATFSPDGNSILTGSGDDFEDNTARLWDLNGNVLQVFREHELAIHSVAFSPDGKTILTGEQDNTIRLWDLQGNILQVFEGHDGFIFSVSFAPDGRRIISGSGDNTARLWDLHGNVQQVFKGHSGTIMSVAFSPDGERILTGSSDKTAMIWDIKKPLKEFQNENDYQELSIEQKIQYGIIDTIGSPKAGIIK